MGRNLIRTTRDIEVELDRKCIAVKRNKKGYDNFRGKFIEEYKNFYVFLHEKDYKEAFMKADFLTGKMEVKYL